MCEEQDFVIAAIVTARGRAGKIILTVAARIGKDVDLAVGLAKSKRNTMRHVRHVEGRGRGMKLLVLIVMVEKSLHARVVMERDMPYALNVVVRGRSPVESATGMAKLHVMTVMVLAITFAWSATAQVRNSLM